MKKRTLVVGVAAGLALAGTAVFFWNGSSSQKAAAQAPRGDQRVVPVTVAKAVKKSVPVRLEALGTVTTIASVAIKPRVDSEIVAVKFDDGARVKQGDVLFVLDSRSIEAEIKRVEAVIAGAEAQFEQAQRDVQRYTDLVAKNATTSRHAQQRADPGQRLARARRFQQGDARRPEGPAQLLHDPRADLRPHQHGQRQGRQHRAAGRPRAARDHQPDRADLRFLHRAAAQPAGRAGGARGRDRVARGGHSRQQRARSRPGHDDREHGRSRDRHGHHPRHHAERRTKCCGRARWSTPR